MMMSRLPNKNEIKNKLFFSLELLPLQIWTLKIKDISNTVLARSYKIGQLIEDDIEDI